MDPVVLILIILAALGTTGAGGVVLRHQHRHRRHAMRNAIIKTTRVDDQRLSLLDVFWDLGVSDFALEVMAAQSMLLKEPEDWQAAMMALQDRVESHGTYGRYLEDTLEAIGEFFREHRDVGSRRLLPALKTSERKLISAENDQTVKPLTRPISAVRPQVNADAQSGEDDQKRLAGSVESRDPAGLLNHSESNLRADNPGESEWSARIEHDPTPGIPDRFDDELLRSISRAERERLGLSQSQHFAEQTKRDLAPNEDALGREQSDRPAVQSDVQTRVGAEGHVMSLPSEPPGAGRAVDLDQLATLNTKQLLQSLFSGNFSHSVRKWWEHRRVRSLRKELDNRFAALYSRYVEAQQSDPRYYSVLYDVVRRWEQEGDRIERLARERVWEDRPWALCADMLVDEARILARQLARQARSNVDATIETIHDHARRGDMAMAGYVVYLNRHAFFAGRSGLCVDELSAIEYALSRLRAEVGRKMTST